MLEYKLRNDGNKDVWLDLIRNGELVESAHIIDSIGLRSISDKDLIKDLIELEIPFSHDKSVEAQNVYAVKIDRNFVDSHLINEDYMRYIIESFKQLREDKGEKDLSLRGFIEKCLWDLKEG